VAVHRQLLRKFASLELENGELRKKLLLRDERIRHLEVNAKGLTSNIRQQAERHITELTDLREQIQVGGWVGRWVDNSSSRLMSGDVVSCRVVSCRVVSVCCGFI
jgi:hypothetical protein